MRSAFSSRLLVGTALGALILLSACGKTDSDGPTDDDEGLGGEEGEGDAPRVKKRFVTIELPHVVTRSVSQDEDGAYLWGQAKALDDVDICVIERRDAFALFEEYEELTEPICVRVSGGETPILTGIPANSDLTITVKKDGYLPVALTHRVETTDILRTTEVRPWHTVLLGEADADLFEALGSDKDSRGFLLIEPSTGSMTQSVGVGDERYCGAPGSPFAVAIGAEVTLSSASSSQVAQTFETQGTQLLLDVPAGIYRSHISQPRAGCEAMGAPFSFTIWGLATDSLGELEARVLPRHVTPVHPLCFCLPPTDDALLVDGATCTFEQAEPAP